MKLLSCIISKRSLDLGITHNYTTIILKLSAQHKHFKVLRRKTFFTAIKAPREISRLIFMAANKNQSLVGTVAHLDIEQSIEKDRLGKGNELRTEDLQAKVNLYSLTTGMCMQRLKLVAQWQSSQC